MFAAGEPFADQRGFTKAGGGRDEGQFAVQPSFSRSIRRGRITTFDRGGGIYSLVDIIGIVIDSLYKPRFSAVNR
jgi:hypothetical protein